MRARVKWRVHDDRGSKDFFDVVLMCPAQTSITELLDAAGIAQTSQSTLEEVCYSFHQSLYSQRLAAPEHTSYRSWAFDGMYSKISPGMAEFLPRPINLEELHKVLTEMAGGKSPGPDSITTELYKCMWPVIGGEYLNMLQESLDRGALPAEVKEGLIALLHKGGGRNTLNNWRPIMLLNVSYKVFAKALQKRLQPVLMELVSHDQSAFLPIRYIWIISF
jgi:hypothetical protein